MKGVYFEKLIIPISFIMTLCICFTIQTQIETSAIIAESGLLEEEVVEEIEEVNPLLAYDHTEVDGDQLVYFISNSIGNAIIITNNGITLNYEKGVQWKDSDMQQLIPFTYKAQMIDNSTMSFICNTESSENL